MPLILRVVLDLRGGGYPPYILTKAGQLNDDTETIELKYSSLYDKILNYWLPPAKGFDICPQWTIPTPENLLILVSPMWSSFTNVPCYFLKSNLLLTSLWTPGEKLQSFK